MNLPMCGADMKKIFAKLWSFIKKWAVLIWRENKILIIPLFCVALIYGIFFVTGVSCPIKFVTGISCPGCGMTRAIFHALKFDFAAAFSFHPLWFGVIPALCAIFLLKTVKKERAATAVISVCAAIMIVTYVVRIFADNSGVVVFHPEENIIARIIRWFAEKGS